MSDSFGNYHEEIKVAVKEYAGTDVLLSKHDIKKRVKALFPEVIAQKILPQQHCDNYQNQSSCDCNHTHHAIFTKVTQSEDSMFYYMVLDDGSKAVQKKKDQYQGQFETLDKESEQSLSRTIIEPLAKTKDIARMFNFTFRSESFAIQGKELIGERTEKRFNNSLFELQKIASGIEDLEFKPPPNIRDIYRSFMKYAPQGYDTIVKQFKFDMIRPLSYTLTFKEKKQPSIIESKYLGLALRLLAENWRNVMIPGLLDALLRKWDSSGSEKIREFLTQVIKIDKFSSPFITMLKKNENFLLNSSGPVNFGTYLVQKRMPLLQSHKLFGLSEQVLTYDYFIQVTVSFTRNAMRKNDFKQFIPKIVGYLDAVKNKKLSMLCLSLIIIEVDSISSLASHNSKLKDQLLEKTKQHVGDPFNDAYWKMNYDVPDNQKREVAKARAILKTWLTKQFIEAVFDHLVIDPPRKAFWLQYVKSIDDFKIFGQNSTKSKLQRQPHLAPYLHTRFGYYNGDGDQVALVMKARGYMLVEFCIKPAAFYAFKTSNSWSPSINSYELHKDYLKPQHLRKTHLSDYETEGKMNHRGHWQLRLSQWLSRHVGINKQVGTYY